MREKLFLGLSNVVGKHPVWVLLIALVLTGVAGGLSETLRIETRILDLMPGDEPAAVEFNDIVRQYDSASQVMVGIEGNSKQQMIAFADALEKRVGDAKYTDKETGEKKPYVKRISVRLDDDFISKHGLMMAKVRDLENMEELYQDLKLAPMLEAYNDFFEREYIEDSGSVTEREKEDRAIDSLKNMMTWLEGVETVDEGDRALKERASTVANLMSVGDPYMFSEDDSLLLVAITPAISVDLTDETVEGVQSLREAADKALEGINGVSFRMAGMPVLMTEETEVMMGDMGIGSLVSLGLVLALFIVAFRMWTAPILAIITLIVGIVWSSGFIAVTIGRLNLMTFMFAVILIGLGIDFAIHLNAAFSTALSRGCSLQEALKEMYLKSGPGVVTGALTTAAAFVALVFTRLDAMVELGVVLGAGIVLTLIASLTVLPALYSIHYRVREKFSKGPLKAKPVALQFSFMGRLGSLVQKRPGVTTILFMAMTVGIGSFARNASFEPDMLKIEPPNMKSVTLHKDILKKFEIHSDYAMVTSDSVDETRKMVKQLKKNRLVGRVDAISDFVPSKQEQMRRARLVKQIGARMAEIEQRAKDKSVVTTDQKTRFLNELVRLQKNIQEMGQLAFTSVKVRLQRTCDRLSGGKDEQFSQVLGLKKRLDKMSGLEAKMATYESAYIPLLASRLSKMSNVEPLTVEMLPNKIKERYLSSEGKNLVTIYASVDLWMEGKTELFLNATKRASDRVTGTAVIMDRLITLIGSKGAMATLLALAAVFVILLVDFRHFGMALLGMLPLIAGFILMMGMFVLMGKKFDVVNVTALPLILGIGIDDAVHVLHALKKQGTSALSDVLAHTGRALLLTSLTTGIAFGTIAASSHRGMAGMGWLLVLGVSACFVASVVLLPALVRIFFKGSSSVKTAEVKEGEK